MKDDRLYLHHMLDRCHRIPRFIAPGKEAFMESEALQDAVIRNVEVIGEPPSGFRPRYGLVWRGWTGKPSAACATS